MFQIRLKYSSIYFHINMDQFEWKPHHLMHPLYTIWTSYINPLS
jgi:hypothetical protein